MESPINHAVILVKNIKKNQIASLHPLANLMISLMKINMIIIAEASEIKMKLLLIKLSIIPKTNVYEKIICAAIDDFDI